VSVVPLHDPAQHSASLAHAVPADAQQYRNPGGSGLIGGRHLEPSRLIQQEVVPSDFVRQQVTYPGLPHVERAAQRLTTLLHSRDRVPLSARVSATPAAQRT
jgi:hypothetical protein